MGGIISRLNGIKIGTPRRMLIEWAKKELEIAKKKYPNDPMGILFDSKACEIYSNMIMEGLNKDDISNIINEVEHLNDGYPLTPLYADGEEWSVYYVTDTYTKYLNERYPYFKKYVYLDGTVAYTDSRRWTELDNSEFHKGTNPHPITPGSTKLINSILDELKPIKIPYYPALEKWTVYTTNTFASKKKADEYNVIMLKHIRYAVKSDGDKIMINRFYKLSCVNDQETWEQIEWNEYTSLRDKIY